MIPIFKYNPAGFDRTRAWNDRYRSLYTPEKSLDEYTQQSFWPKLKSYLKKDGRYLDVGCGIGGWVLFLNEQGFQADGVDSNASAVRALSEYNPDVSVKIASAGSIPYADETFDGVLSIGSLEYAEGEVASALKEMHRTVKKGGFICVEVPLYNGLRQMLYVPMKRLEGVIRKSQDRKPTFAYYLFGRREFEKMITDAGFSIQEVLPHDLPDAKSHFGLYANWPLLRGKKPYELNVLGLLVKAISNTLSPWVASAGIVVIAKK
jgi:SAM-dependent methyltransferase